MPPGFDPLGSLFKWLLDLFTERTLRDAGAVGPVATVSVPISATGYTMRELFLHRDSGGFGYILVDGTVYHTLENQAAQIPAGTYQVNWEPSPRFGRETYRLVSVPGRSGILIHPANFQHELDGCIALGKARAGLAIVQSRTAVEEFEKQLGRDSFNLVIA